MLGLVAQVAVANAAEVVCDMSNKAWSNVNAYSNVTSKSTDGNWAVTNANNANNTWDYFKIGKSKDTQTGMIQTLKPMADAVSEVSLTISTVNIVTATITAYELVISDDATFDASDVTIAGSISPLAAGDYSIAVPANKQGQNKYYSLNITVNNTASTKNGAISVTKATFTTVASEPTTPPATLLTPEFAFAKDEDTVTLGESYSLPTLTNTSDNKTVTYSVDPEGIVSIAADGSVSLLKAGEVIITASIAATATYEAADAMLMLTVAESSLATPTFAFDLDKDTATLGSPYTLPFLTNTSDNQSVTYSVDPADVVSIATDGSVSLLKAGDVIITASIAATDTYKAATAVMMLTVIDPNAIIDVINESSYTSGSYTPTKQLNGSDGIQYGLRVTKNYSCVQMNGTTTGIITVANPKGHTVKSINVVWGTNTNAGNVFKVYGSNEPYNDTFSNITTSNLIGSYTYVKGSENISIAPNQDFKYIAIIGNGKVIYLSSITFTWQPAVTEPVVEQVGEITFNPASGATLYGSETVSIECATPDAELTYQLGETIDIYSGPISLPSEGTHTITVVAAKEGMTSREASATFTYVASKPLDPCAAVVASVAANETIYGATTITLSTPTEGATITYSLTGSEGFAAVTDATYSAPIALSIDGSYTLSAKASKEGMADSPETNVVFTYAAKPTCPVVSFEPASGTTLYKGDMVRINAPEGCTAVYSLNGSDYSAYVAPIALTDATDGTVTISAYALRDGYNNSPIASATYDYKASSRPITPILFDVQNHMEEIAFYNGGQAVTSSSIDTATKGDVTLSFDNVTTATALILSDNTLRVYKNTTMTVSVPDGYQLDKIEFTFSGAAYIGFNGYTAASTAPQITWTADPDASVSSANFKATATNRITQLLVTYSKIQPKAEPVTFAPDKSDIWGDASVTLASATPDATIRYSINDGEEQTYTAPITFTTEDTYVITARATKAEYKDSDPTSATFHYFLEEPIPSCAPVTFTPDGGNIFDTDKVTLACAEPDATITYSINGGETLPYTAPFGFTAAGTYEVVATSSKAGFRNNTSVATFTYDPYRHVLFDFATDETRADITLTKKGALVTDPSSASSTNKTEIDKAVKGDITINFTDGGNPTKYFAGNMRLYKDGTLTVTTPANKQVRQIIFNTTQGSFYANDRLSTQGSVITWATDDDYIQSVELSVESAVRITSIEVLYNEIPYVAQCEPVQILPIDTDYLTDRDQVVLTCPTPLSRITVKVEGTNKDGIATLDEFDYTKPFGLTTLGATTVTAIAHRDGSADSEPASTTFQVRHGNVQKYVNVIHWQDFNNPETQYIVYYSANLPNCPLPVALVPTTEATTLLSGQLKWREPLEPRFDGTEFREAINGSTAAPLAFTLEPVNSSVPATWQEACAKQYRLKVVGQDSYINLTPGASFLSPEGSIVTLVHESDPEHPIDYCTVVIADADGNTLGYDTNANTFSAYESSSDAVCTKLRLDRISADESKELHLPNLYFPGEEDPEYNPVPNRRGYNLDNKTYAVEIEASPGCDLYYRVTPAKYFDTLPKFGAMANPEDGNYEMFAANKGPKHLSISHIGSIDYFQQYVHPDGTVLRSPVTTLRHFDEQTTTLTSVDDSAASAPLYDLQGRRVLHPTHGLYLRAGRKFLVK